jgi:hypothetical protein
MNEKDSHITPVIFRKKFGEITAVFPTLPWSLSGDTVTVYAHVGQHGQADWGWYNSTKAVKPEEYASLLSELEGFGYRLRVYRKRTAKHRAEFDAELRRYREGMRHE